MTGSFQIKSRNAEQERSVRTPETENRVLQQFVVSPLTIAAEMGVQHEMVWMVLRAENMHPFYVQKFQLLDNDDYPFRVEIVHWILDNTQTDSQLTATFFYS